MTLRTEQIQDEFQRPVPGAQIYVYNQDGSQATLTSNGTLALAQPVVSDANGFYTYYAADAVYREEIWFGGKLRYEVSVIVGAPASLKGPQGDGVPAGLVLTTPQQYGAVADNVTSDNAAYVNTLAGLATKEITGFGYGSAVGPISVPLGTYYMGTSAIDFNDTLQVAGPGTGDAGGWAAVLRWGAGCHGFRVQHYNTTGDTATYAPTVTRGGQASIISGLALEGGYGTTEGEFHGFFLRARASLRDLNIWNWQGDGIRIHADTQQPEAGNASNCEILSALIQNTRDGVNITGGDANQGITRQLKIISARRWGIYDERAWIHLGPLTQQCGFSGGDGTTVAKAVSVVSNVAGTHRFAVIAGRETQASTNAPPVTAVDDSNWYYFEDGGSAVGLPTWFNGIDLRSGGSYRLVNGGIILNGYHEGGQPPAQLGAGVLRIGGTWPTNSVRGGAYIAASSNQVEMNSLRVTAGGISYDDDQTGTLMLGRYSSGLQSAFLKCSTVATDLTIRSPDNTDGIVISNAAVGISKDANLASGKVLKVNSVQVVGARATGWAVDTGTAKRTANATYGAGATLTYSAAYVQAEQTAMATRMAAVEAALQNATQTIKALKDDLHGTAGHGLIGT